jgi:hypothetical protein
MTQNEFGAGQADPGRSDRMQQITGLCQQKNTIEKKTFAPSSQKDAKKCRFRDLPACK